MANSRQIALRTRLRHHYWLTECRPIGVVTVNNLRRKMAMIDPQDSMPDEQVEELLSLHYGFAKLTDSAGQFIGWSIPDLDEALRVATESINATRERMAQLGKASALKRQHARAMAGPQGTAKAPEVIDRETGEILPGRSQVLSGAFAEAAADDDADF